MKPVSEYRCKCGYRTDDYMTLYHHINNGTREDWDAGLSILDAMKAHIEAEPYFGRAMTESEWASFRADRSPVTCLTRPPWVTTDKYGNRHYW